ncbi:MAG: hypothetical protein HLX51_06360 [Micrococcaceae bacterium]|nr:hypothetical protein [Micrococcaceae bacterium]
MSYNRNHLPYGQGPSVPRWLRVVYLWLMVSLGASFVAWLGFRAFADATRGDLVPALISLGIGAVAGAVTTWAIYARKSKR